MALKRKEFDINYITAVKGRSVDWLKFANFRYKNADKFPRIIVHGGMNVVKGKFELDIKDDNPSSDILQHSQNRPTGDRWLKF